jgi:hypothetical protein
MSKDWKKELEEYIARATKKQHISDKLIIAVNAPEHKAKVSAFHKGISKPKSKEAKDNMALAAKGKKKAPRSATHSANIAAAKRGIPRSEKTKAKVSVALKGIPKPKVTCPHCSKEGGISQMKQWHFDNCKLKRD